MSIYYDVVRSSTNKACWCLRQNYESGPSTVFGYTKFTSKRKAQDWADRLNAVAQQEEDTAARRLL